MLTSKIVSLPLTPWSFGSRLRPGRSRRLTDRYNNTEPPFSTG